jgi:hypothetical protein
MTLHGGRLASVGSKPREDKRNAHISDNIRIDELTFVLPD